MVENNLTFVTRKDENGKPLPFENRRKVFISYKKTDNRYRIRDRIVSYVLSAFDCAVWFDDSLTPGIDYDEEISQAIKASDVVVLLLTENILESDYVWNIEIKQALSEGKGIIPILLNFNPENSGTLEQRLGHRQLLDGSRLLDSEATVEEKNRFLEALKRAIQQFLLKQDLAMCVLSFFAAQKHQVPVRSLSVEQLYYMAFGLLNGLGTDANSREAVRLLQSLLQLYAKDVETGVLKAEIVHTLIKHAISTEDYDTAKAYIGNIDEYRHAPLYYYVGSLYQGSLEDNPQLALAYYLKGAELDHLESVRAAAQLLLHPNKWNPPNRKAYDAALPYFVKAAELGDAAELIDLMIVYWNPGGTPSDRKAACNALCAAGASKLGDNRKIAAFLESIAHTPSRLSTFSIKDYGPIAPQERLGEVTLGKHSFFLLRDKLDEKHNNMLLVRDDKVLCEFCCWAYGFGDIDSFELLVDGDYLIVKSSDFCHYDRETNLCDHVFLNPLSSNPLICTHNFDTKPGRVLLRYPAYG